MHDICAIHIRRNSSRNHLKLLMAKWLELSSTVRVRVTATDREWTSFLLFFLLWDRTGKGTGQGQERYKTGTGTGTWLSYKVTNTFVLLS